MFTPDDVWDNPAIAQYKRRMEGVERFLKKTTRKPVWGKLETVDDVLEVAEPIIRAGVATNVLVDSATLGEMYGLNYPTTVPQDVYKRGVDKAVRDSRHFFDEDNKQAFVEAVIEDSVHNVSARVRWKTLDANRRKIFRYRQSQFLIVPSIDACEFCQTCSEQLLHNPRWSGHVHCHCKTLPLLLDS